MLMFPLPLAMEFYWLMISPRCCQSQVETLYDIMNRHACFSWILRLCAVVPNGLRMPMPTTLVLWDSARLFGAISLMSFVACFGRAADSYTEESGSEGDGKFTIGPEYKIDPDLTDRGNPKGKSFEFTLRLADSKIFSGTDSTLQPEKKAVRKERKIFVYVPAAYKEGDKAPFLIIHDKPGQLKLVRNALDNLTISKEANRKLPAFIAIAVENGGNDGKKSERGLEYDTMSDRLARFIHDEVLPAVLTNAEIKASYPKLAFTE